MVMSNELSTPKILYCPSDNMHATYSSTFAYQSLLGIAAPNVTGTGYANCPAEGITQISYFINGDATEANPQDIMTGDCNIGSVGASGASTPSSYRFGYTSIFPPATATANATYAKGLTSPAFSGPNGYWAWTATDMHLKSGNLGMADGSCQSETIPGLHALLLNSTNAAIGEAYNFNP